MNKHAVILLLFLIVVGCSEARRRRVVNPTSCHEANSSVIVSRVKESEVVFTGKVASVLDALFEEEPGLEIQRNLRVRIKRVFKGDIDSSGPVELLLPIYQGDSFEKCSRQVPRVHDTAIFLARHVSPPPNVPHRIGAKHRDKFALIDRPLPLTLTNLDIVNSAVKDITYKPRPPILEEPCEKTFCAFGANCHTDEASGEAKCRCPEECSQGGTPVCGSDGRSYINDCVLRVVACQKQENLRVHHFGNCGVVSESNKRAGITKKG